MLLVGCGVFVGVSHFYGITLRVEHITFNNKVDVHAIPERRVAFFVGEPNGEFTGIIMGEGVTGTSKMSTGRNSFGYRNRTSPYLCNPPYSEREVFVLVGTAEGFEIKLKDRKHKLKFNRNATRLFLEDGREFDLTTENPLWFYCRDDDTVEELHELPAGLREFVSEPQTQWYRCWFGRTFTDIFQVPPTSL